MLERDWLASLRLKMLAQAAGMVFGGLAVTGLFQLALGDRKNWAPAAWLAFLAYFVWSYYLVFTFWLPLGLLLAFIATGIALRFSRRAGRVMLWVLPADVFLVFILLPALRAVL